LTEIGAHALAEFCIGTGIPRAFFAREFVALCKLALEEAPVQALDAVYQGGKVDFVRLSGLTGPAPRCLRQRKRSAIVKFGISKIGR
jgi:hypothetical protein